ncbi:hypothetical protein CEB3_c06880 [Peptococcaceae bacterium CEB3]|nr:hypothetical protein CEB3_c06880 [Peptococcaceae bacterium CEB3]
MPYPVDKSRGIRLSLLVRKRCLPLKAIALGILASFFFAFTFVLNRAMNLAGGSWIWSAALRYLFMVPPLLAIVAARRNLKDLFSAMRARPLSWLGWSTVGFGLFYTPLCFAASYGPAWLVAGMWQMTIVAGSLLAPFFQEIVQTNHGYVKMRARIPLKGLGMSLVILAGVAIIQVQNAYALTLKEILLGVLPVALAAFAYPLGNRKMMALCGSTLNTYQRVLGMTLASMPFWLLLSLYGLLRVGAPAPLQVAQSFVVALSSGVVATILFFTATNATRGNMHKLAAVEATQSGELIFSLLGEVVLLHGNYPSALSFAGIALIVLGMIGHSLVSHRTKTRTSVASPVFGTPSDKLP